MRQFTTFALAGLVLTALSSGFAADERALTRDMVDRIEASFDSSWYRPAIINAVTNNSIKDLCLNRDLMVRHDNHFNLRLDRSGITNQRGSGRCWLFAGLNVFNPDVMKKLDMSSFELSQPYLTFWDKLEKANFFLEEVIRLRDRPLYDRELSILLDSPFGDGGWWHYATDLIDKYGVVPLSAMPETKQSGATGTVNKLANTKLRAFASELREMRVGGASVELLRERKTEMLGEIYTLLVYAYGEPPTEFMFRYEDKDSTLTEPRTYTPRAFYQEFLGGSLPEYAVLMDNPGKDYDVMYRIESSRNMADREDLTALNLPIETLKEYCLRSLKDSTVIWFACDVGHDHVGDSGIFARNAYDFEAALGLDFDISKADRIGYADSYPNHAMVIIGADTASDGRSLKWLVENSWGTKRGDDGYWTMYDDWFDEYVYMVVVEKKLLRQEDRAKLDQKPVLLPTWDPFYKAARTGR